MMSLSCKLVFFSWASNQVTQITNMSVGVVICWNCDSNSKGSLNSEMIIMVLTCKHPL